MRIFFEGAKYKIEQLTDVDASLYYYTNGGYSFSHIGYSLPQGEVEPVVILPKVFLDKGLKFLNNDPALFIDVDKALEELRHPGDNKIKLPDGVDEKSLKEAVLGMSTWVYRSIAHYNKRIAESQIAEESNIQNVISEKEQGTGATYLETILQLFEFEKTHKNLFSFITNVNRQGRNKVVWNKTIKKSLPLIQGGSPIYMDLYTKKKEMNFDEELFKLFFSTLKYLKATYSFEYDEPFNYDTYPASQIEQMLSSGRGTRLLRGIRYKYFADDMVKLWNLLFAFFDKAEKVKSHRNSSEKLLVRNYNLVFEDMIEQLIGEDNHLKSQKDGKIIDHLYKEKDLHNSDSFIYYIADSKYYMDTSDLTSESVYKQYTYAKNIIQYNMDLFNSNQLEGGLRYRDELTEGYNITPNFFIRGTITSQSLNDRKSAHLEHPTTDKNEKQWDGFRKNFHYKNRLFDRDTLPTQEYFINFMFVIACYVANSKNEAFKQATRKKFKEDLTKVLNEKYCFYTMKCQGGNLKDEIDRHFRQLNGKIYRLNDKDDRIILALEKCYILENLLLLSLLRKSFELSDAFKLGETIPTPAPKQKSYSETTLFKLVAESENAFIDKGSEETILFGCYKNKEHKKWIEENMLYNVRFDDREGSVKEETQKFSATKLVLYNVDNPKEYNTYIIGAPECQDADFLSNKGYPQPYGKQYLIYKIKESTEEHVEYCVNYIFDYIDNYVLGAPIYITTH